MIQVSDSKELKSKVTKSALADTAEKESWRLDKQQVVYILFIFAVVVAEFFLRKLGWFVLPLVFVPAWLFAKRGQQIEELKGRTAAYKPLKTVHPKRDSFR
jgi:hypothetical protein